MPRFYEPFTKPVMDSWIKLGEESSHHAMRVLRLKQDEVVEIFNGLGLAVSGPIFFSKEEVKVQVKTLVEQRKTLEITLIQALLTNEKLDWIIEKACELGVSDIRIYASERGEVKLTGEKLSKRIERWQKIAISACKQCGQNTLPVISYANCLKGALTVKSQKNFILLPTAEKLQKEDQAPKSVSFIVGPEGGLSETEINTATANGSTPLRLGNLVLRTETAGLAAVSFAQTLWGNWH